MKKKQHKTYFDLKKIEKLKAKVEKEKLYI